MRVYINEAGHEHVAFGINDLIRFGRFAGHEHGGDAGSIDEHGATGNVNAGGNDASIGYECFHGYNTWYRRGSALSSCPHHTYFSASFQVKTRIEW